MGTQVLFGVGISATILVEEDQDKVESNGWKIGHVGPKECVAAHEGYR